MLTMMKFVVTRITGPAQAMAQSVSRGFFVTLARFGPQALQDGLAVWMEQVDDGA